MEGSNYSNWQIFLKILDFAKKFKKPLIAVLCLSFLVNVINGLNGYILSKIIDVMQTGGTSNEAFMTSLKLIGVSVVLIILRILFVGKQNILEIKKITNIMQNALSYEALSKFFNFSKGQHLNEHSGIRQSVVSNGISSIQSQIDSFINQLFPTAGMFLVAFVIIFYANPLIGIIYLFGAILFGFMLSKHHKKMIPSVKKIREKKQENFKKLSEFFHFVGLVKNENQENRALNEIEEAQDEHQKLYEDALIPGNSRRQKILLLSNSVHILARILGLYLFFIEKNMSIGQFLLVFNYGSDIVNSIWQFMGIHKTFIMDKINIERYIDLLEIKTDIVLPENPIKPEKLIGEIEFKNITFHYPVRKSKNGDSEQIELDPEPMLKNVSFRIKPGEKIGIVGESGSGKTTISRLIRRSFDPQEGQVLIDGNDVRLIDLPWFLQNMGIVDQPVELLDRSIKENILFGLNGRAKNFSDEKLKALAKMTRIDGFFDKLEHGFDTVVGERGLKLSGGEQQRIGIARALAKDPSILILDEATSALDASNEKVVQEAIDEACKGKTSIVIAHRLSTVKNCDRILVFRNGILLDEGSHNELLEKCEYYRELVSNQLF